MASNERITQAHNIDVPSFERVPEEDTPLIEFQAIFPWMSGEDIDTFRRNMECKYPELRTPLKSLFERAKLSIKQQTKISDLPIDEFCGIFPITQEEAIEFSERRMGIGWQTPLASIITGLKDVPPLYRDQFARQAVSVENFGMKRSSEATSK